MSDVFSMFITKVTIFLITNDTNKNELLEYKIKIREIRFISVIRDKLFFLIKKCYLKSHKK
jgi:hypothetical protein